MPEAPVTPFDHSRQGSELLEAALFEIKRVIAGQDVMLERVLVCLLIGSIPLGLLGIMLGYLLSERGALPVTNLIYLPLSYAGGLFSANSGELPHVVRRVSPWLPTRQWSDLLLDFGLGGRLPGHQLVALSGYGVLFAVAAVYGYRRDEQRQYR